MQPCCFSVSAPSRQHLLVALGWTRAAVMFQCCSPQQTTLGWTQCSCVVSVFQPPADRQHLAASVQPSVSAPSRQHLAASVSAALCFSPEQTALCCISAAVLFQCFSPGQRPLAWLDQCSCVVSVFQPPANDSTCLDQPRPVPMNHRELRILRPQPHKQHPPGGRLVMP